MYLIENTTVSLVRNLIKKLIAEVGYEEALKMAENEEEIQLVKSIGGLNDGDM